MHIFARKGASSAFARAQLKRLRGADMTVAAVFGLSALCGCAQRPDSAPGESGASARETTGRSNSLPLRRFPSDVAAFYRLNSGVRDSAVTVVRDIGAWGDVWRRLTEGHAPPPPPPAIEFGREMALVATLGWRRSGGYAITIDTVIERGTYLEAHVRRRAAGRTCTVTGTFTAPADIVVIGRREGDVRTVVTDTVVECGQR